jgi:hypothetical protein
VNARERVYKALLASGIKGTYVAYPVGKAPPLPWFTYREEDNGEVFADDTNYAEMPHYMVRLYQKDADQSVERALGDAIAKIGPYRRFQTWSATENCLITTYQFTLTEEVNNG